jgi:hypothetical protein
MAKHKDNHAVMVAAETASKALDRFQATETFAQRLFRPEGNSSIKAVLSAGNLHVVLTDGKTTLEVSNGQAAIAVAEG